MQKCIWLAPPWGGDGEAEAINKMPETTQNVQKFGVNMRFEIVAKQSHETPNTLAASSL